jgi:3-oxoacyl-[acyl-carrier protein] reductase
MGPRVAVVTGASRGIGKQFSVDLAKAGFDVVCAARSTDDHASKLPGTIEETAALVRAEGREAMVAPLDVRDEAACAALAERVLAEWGRCDLLVNNAAIAPPLPALQDSTRRWRLAVDVNVNGPFYLSYYFAPRMPAGDGRVVNISSGAAVTPEFGRPSYTATKLALEGMTRGLAVEQKGVVAHNVIRLDLAVWSEGFADTLPADNAYPFEHPIIMSDALLWLARQPISHTGHVHSISELRAQGIVRPVTHYRDFAG